MLLCGHASAAERAGGCYTSASWLFETSDRAFPDTPTGATSSCEYTDAEGRTSRFYYRLTFTHDPVENGAEGQTYPYVRLEDDVIRGSIASITVNPYFITSSKPEPNYCFEAYRRTVLAHEEQHKADALRWPAIGNGKTKSLLDKFDDYSGEVSAALGSGYSQAEALMQEIRVTENNIRTVMEARGVHAELSIHYRFMNWWRNQDLKGFVKAPFLFEPEPGLQGYEPYYYSDLKDVDNFTLAKIVVESILYSEHSFHKSHKEKSHTDIAIQYTFADAGEQFTYKQAHEAFFGKIDSAAATIVRENRNALNSGSEQSYKRMEELQKRYCEQMAELIAMYVKWKHYENRFTPEKAYSIRQEDIVWVDESEPQKIDTLDYAREMGDLMMQVDWFAEGEPATPQEYRCRNLIMAKKIPGMILDESATEEEKLAYLRKLYAADAKIMHNIARLVASRDPQEKHINTVVQVICSARGLPGVFLPAKVDSLIRQDKARRAARADNRSTGTPETVAEYYESIAALLQLYGDERTQEEYDVLAQGLLFFIAGRASKQNVEVISQSLEKARDKARKKQQRRRGYRRRI